jgi:hypothetical protein
MSRFAAGALSFAMISATLSPLVRDPGPTANDSFPLSTYPMFAYQRRTVMTMLYALGTTASGETRELTPALIGSGEVMQAKILLDQAASQRRLPTLCAAIAARVAHDGDHDDIVTIRIVEGTHDAVDYLVRHQPGREGERARCTVPR